jgi:hypothetical protein
MGRFRWNLPPPPGLQASSCLIFLVAIFEYTVGLTNKMPKRDYALAGGAAMLVSSVPFSASVWTGHRVDLCLGGGKISTSRIFRPVRYRGLLQSDASRQTTLTHPRPAADCDNLNGVPLIAASKCANVRAGDRGALEPALKSRKRQDRDGYSVASRPIHPQCSQCAKTLKSHWGVPARVRNPTD